MHTPDDARVHLRVPSRASMRPLTAIASVIASVVIALAVACSNHPAGTTGTDTTRNSPTQQASASDCSAMPSKDSLTHLLKTAPDSGNAGGLFGGRAEWASVVNRAGQVCATAVANDSLGGRWPGSRSISMAKAFTANGFSTDTLALSTARLYTMTQPGHSLWGVGQPEPFNPDCLDPGSNTKICGGAISFGGGVPLYRKGRIIGGLGLSGDTPCADHEIAKRIRHMLGMDPKAGELVDDITYSKVDGASIYTHPLCPNTWRNGQKIGDEPPASGY
jgi:uncharacterized protein GlcG (DUF336 family)